MNFTKLFLVLGLFLSLSAHAEDDSKPLSLNSSDVEGQFDYVYQKSNNYEEFKMIKRWQYVTLKNHVLDTLKLIRSDLDSTAQEVLARNARIDSLKQLQANTLAEVERLEKEKNSIALLGISMNKTAYNSLLWSIILILTLAMGLFILLYKRSNSVTVQYKTDLNTTREEFESFRKRALEREESVVRKYHDELMKYKSKQPSNS